MSPHRTTRWDVQLIAGWTWALAAATGVATIALAVAGMPTVATQTLIMVGLVALVGLPHGAYDLQVGRELLETRLGRAWWPTFGGVYVLLAVAALLAWTALPTAALVLLLVGGAIHWGADDLETPPHSRTATLVLALARGSVPVALPLAAHPDATARIFAALLGGTDPAPETIRAIGTAWIVLAVPGVLWTIRRAAATGPAAAARAAIEVAVLAGWFIVAPPLLAFTLYFCLWHSVRHALASAGRIDPDDAGRALRTYVRRVIGPTLLTLVLAVPAWLALDQRLGGEPPSVAAAGADGDDAGWWRLVFVGLFALTVPHVLLEWVVSTRDRRRATNAETGPGSGQADAAPTSSDHATS